MDYKDEYFEWYEYNLERKIAIMATLEMMNPPRTLRPREGETAIIAEAIERIFIKRVSSRQANNYKNKWDNNHNSGKDGGTRPNNK